MPQNEKTRFGLLLFVVIVTGLTLSLTGCATTSPPPVSPCPTLPAIPSGITPPPSQTYSANARQKLEDWQSRLTTTPLIPQD